MAIWVKPLLDERLRSTLKPDSLSALSCQLRLIWLDETAVADNPLGAFGRVSSVVALAVFEGPEKEDLLYALTR